jgi:hypothetical protein
MGLHSKSGAEKFGFWLTIICGIHCISTPILLTFLPILGSKFEAFHQYELVILLGSLIVAFFLMKKDFKIHKNPIPRQMIVAAFFIASLGWNLFQETAVSIIVALLIVSAYWLNWKHKEKCNCKQSF